MIIGTLVCWIILTNHCLCVHSKVIIVNSNNGNDSTECCVNGTCTCSSLSTALLNIDNNTIINITSESVALNNTTTMGSGKLTNITITGSNVTVMCNNSGSVYCESCDDVMIEGITWDRCGDPNGTNIAGVTFNGISNISLINCTFQLSQLLAVSLLLVSNNNVIQGCNNRGETSINMFMVNFISNQYTGLVGGALTVILPYENGANHCILLTRCNFVSNRSPSYGAALYIDTRNGNDNIQIVNTSFDQNEGASVVYLQGFLHSLVPPAPLNINYNQAVKIDTSNFTNNIGSALYLSSCNATFSGNLLFRNNTAESGGAMYVEQKTTVTIDDNATVQFINNTAKIHGGAIYVDLMCSLTFGGMYQIINTFQGGAKNSKFINNSARIADNSLYFNVPRPIVVHKMSKQCSIHTNISDSHSILHVPCNFTYFKNVNGNMIDINPCDLDYTLLNGTGAPIVTSPHELRLYFPFNDGYNISSTSDRNIYFVRNHILGRPVKFTGAVFDYFGKPTDPTQFNIQLQCSQNSECSAYALMSDNHNYIFIDNSTILNVNFKGERIDTTCMNLTVALVSLLYSLNHMNATLVVELVPCIDHPGYTYSEESQTCVCYHHNVKCNDDRNEIKRGYWFGSITSKATTSLCPNHYCEFTNRKQTSEGCFELPNTINAQCNDHRVGKACGECSSGYTLSYDSTDCISVDQCGTGWTVLVIALTCLYWIVVVVGVFSLMYFRSKISLGYLYGLIYYYSMVSILLNNNQYVSDDALQFVLILSSVAQLTPQFLGKLCFVKGLSGIDQLFIHYSHAVGVSLLLLLIVVAARCSARVSLFVSRCIIRVICLLILLSYTSIASTSLQLLLPLKFTDIKEWYTYLSPSIQYFHGRHIIYGVIAVICELVVGVGLPLLLLLEPVLSKKINFIKIKPLLDQFQGSYKDKHRWFAAYYLICRQVIFLIVYIFNSNYSNMLFYLQTTCVIIAIIHVWIQPYQNEFLNALDGVMLLFMVLEVSINAVPLLQYATTEISLLIVMLPLILFSIIIIKKVVHFYLMKWHHRHYDLIDDCCMDDERESDVDLRYVFTLQSMCCH